MLVLSRDCGESFMIGTGIKITLIRAQNGRARIGVQAPLHVHILRSNAKTKTPPPGETKSQASASPA
jgi:carbon storage regulator